MELEIEEELLKRYKNLKIKVKFKDFRKYIIELEFIDDTAFIEFTYDNHFIFEVNMNSLSNFIDQVILEYYRREKNHV